MSINYEYVGYKKKILGIIMRSVGYCDWMFNRFDDNYCLPIPIQAFYNRNLGIWQRYNGKCRNQWFLQLYLRHIWDDQFCRRCYMCHSAQIFLTLQDAAVYNNPHGFRYNSESVKHRQFRSTTSMWCAYSCLITSSADSTGSSDLENNNLKT